MTHGKVATAESSLKTELAGRVSRADSVSRAQSREREIVEHNERLLKANFRQDIISNVSIIAIVI